MKKILITGVSKGLGWGIAQYFLNEGFKVLGISRGILEDLNKNENFKHLALDLSDLSSIQPSVKKFLADEGDLEYIVLNAGMLGEIKDLQETSMEDLKTLMDVNVWSNKELLDTVFTQPSKVKQVVAISSGASINGNRGWGGYSISKAALNMMIKLYAAEKEAVHFNTLAPGLIDTGMQDYLCGEVDESKFESTLRLKAAKGTSSMPKPKEAGVIIGKAIPKLIEYQSGDYVDVRKM
ncbi:SDR family NAD(P)-dependent oxidoreductase [Limibacter armeniacum]|uniref:SDR family NAD(P)-dependent oxidoreductase n=1 Tax=Limibacter armeniacum TaxID=466084 RepID=UPI002FE6648E